jgi:hypothetical protein
MLSKRYTNLVFIFLMAGGMSLAMSFVMTIMLSRLDAGFTMRWMRAFLIGYAVAFPTALVIAPAARRLADRICR